MIFKDLIMCYYCVSTCSDGVYVDVNDEEEYVAASLPVTDIC